MSNADRNGKRAAKARRRNLARAHAPSDGFESSLGEAVERIDLGGDGGGA